MAKYISKLINEEELYYLKDGEARQNLSDHAENTEIHVTAAEKEYWNSKVNPPSYSAPTAKQLTYTGEAQDLLNPGSSTSGSIQYSTDEVNWSTTIPQGTNAGTYTVYWRFIGTELIYVNSTEIAVSIAKADRTVTISGNQTSMTSGQSNTITVTATDNPDSSLISITSSNTAVAIISGTTVNAVSGGITTITATVASDTNYNSGSTSYSLRVAWPNGIYAAYADGSMRTAENADTNAIGVAVITDNCSFIIDKGNETRTYWDNSYSTNGVISGCFATDSADTAKIDYAGVTNTNAIAAVAFGGEAAKHCRSCSKTINGSTVYGYLGACGEWNVAYANKSDITAIMSAIGGTALQESYYWSSTLSLSYSYRAWALYWRNGYVTYGNKYADRYVRPLYAI